MREVDPMRAVELSSTSREAVPRCGWPVDEELESQTSGADIRSTRLVVDYGCGFDTSQKNFKFGLIV